MEHEQHRATTGPSTPSAVPAPGPVGGPRPGPAAPVDPDATPDATPAATPAPSTGPADTSAQEAAGEEQVLVLESWQVALPATGDDQVDAALARLADVEGLAPSEHPDLYEAVHDDLQAALADLEQA